MVDMGASAMRIGWLRCPIVLINHLVRPNQISIIGSSEAHRTAFHEPCYNVVARAFVVRVPTHTSPPIDLDFVFRANLTAAHKRCSNKIIYRPYMSSLVASRRVIAVKSRVFLGSRPQEDSRHTEGQSDVQTGYYFGESGVGGHLNPSYSGCLNFPFRRLHAF